MAKLVIGLGNPGRRYRDTRHNVGWMVLDEVARRYGLDDEQERYEGLLGQAGPLLLFKPLTYMNRSGRAVRAALDGLDIEFRDSLTVVDDFSLPLGSLRMKPSGSSGGHRGLESIVEKLDSEEWPRLRLGIGPCPPRMPAKDFVLSKFLEDELPELDRMIDRGAEAVQCWAERDIQTAMDEYNERRDASA